MSAPDSPLTPMAQGAASAHELFRSYVDAGFTEPQALQILIALLIAARREMENGEGS